MLFLNYLPSVRGGYTPTVLDTPWYAITWVRCGYFWLSPGLDLPSSPVLASQSQQDWGHFLLLSALVFEPFCSGSMGKYPLRCGYPWMGHLHSQWWIDQRFPKRSHHAERVIELTDEPIQWFRIVLTLLRIGVGYVYCARQPLVAYRINPPI